jgi:hypothetical protein
VPLVLPGSLLEGFEQNVRRLWASLSPGIDRIYEEIIEKYLELGPSTPYRIAKNMGLSTATVYRRSRSLLEKRILIPYSGGDSLMVSVKGCIVLYSRQHLGLEGLTECSSKIWGISLDAYSLLGFLYLLGLEAEQRKLTIQTLTMCKIDEASIHVLRYLREALVTHLASAKSFAEALDEVAARYCIPPRIFRGALRLALRGIATTLPVTLTSRDHKVVVFLHDRALYYFVVECSRPCEEYERSLGLECPLAARLVQERLRGILSGLPYPAAPLAASPEHGEND